MTQFLVAMEVLDQAGVVPAFNLKVIVDTRRGARNGAVVRGSGLRDGSYTSTLSTPNRFRRLLGAVEAYWRRMEAVCEYLQQR
jgi:hypothetical protein